MKSKKKLSLKKIDISQLNAIKGGVISWEFTLPTIPTNRTIGFECNSRSFIIDCGLNGEK